MYYATKHSWTQLLQCIFIYQWWMMMYWPRCCGNDVFNFCISAVSCSFFVLSSWTTLQFIEAHNTTYLYYSVIVTSSSVHICNTVKHFIHASHIHSSLKVGCWKYNIELLCMLFDDNRYVDLTQCIIGNKANYNDEYIWTGCWVTTATKKPVWQSFLCTSFVKNLIHNCWLLCK